MLGHVHRYAVWLDDKNGLPAKVVSYDAKDDMIETVVLKDIRINPIFPKEFFNPEPMAKHTFRPNPENQHQFSYRANRRGLREHATLFGPQA